MRKKTSKQTIEINGKRIEYQIFDNPEYNMFNDDISLEHIAKLLDEGYREGELFDYEKSTESPGWWKIV